MSLLTLLLIAAGAYGGYKLVDAVKTSAAGEKLMSDITAVKFVKKSFTEVELYVTFRHANPTNKLLKFDFMFLDFFIDNIKFASVREQSLNVLLRANKVSSHTIKVEVPLIGAAITAAELIMSGKVPKLIKVVGPIKVGSYVTEYNSEYPVTIPFI